MALITDLPTFWAILMASNNLTQKGLGDLCNRDHTTICKLTGKRSMNTSTLKTLMDVMGEDVTLVLKHGGKTTILKLTGRENMHMRTLEKVMAEMGEVITLVLKSGHEYTLKIAK